MQAAAQRTGRPDAAADVLSGLLDGPSRPLVTTRAAQKTILSASGERVVATDLSGPSALVRLIDSATGSTVALLQAQELEDLQRRYGTRDGGLVLRRGQALRSLRWEERRLIRAILGKDETLSVHVERSRPHRLVPQGTATGPRPPS
jgi:processive 1,2-diacylglycerol beta-glucosyltransferase